MNFKSPLKKIQLAILTFSISLGALCCTAQDATKTITRSERISKLAVSPNGKTIAVIEGTKSNLILIAADTGEVVYEYGQLFEIFSPDTLTFSPNGEYLIAASRHRGIKVLEISEDGLSLEDRSSFKIENHGEQVGIARDTPLIAGFTINGNLNIYDYISGDHVKSINLSEFRVHSPQDIHLSAQGGHALLMGFDSILLVDVEKEEVLQRFKDSTYRSNCRFNHDGTKVFGVSGTTCTILDVQTGNSRARELEHYSSKAALVGDANEVLIVHEGQLTVHDASSFRVTMELDIGHDKSDPWEEVIVSEDGSRAVLRNRDYSEGKIMVVDLKPDEE